MIRKRLRDFFFGVEEFYEYNTEMHKKLTKMKEIYLFTY